MLINEHAANSQAKPPSRAVHTAGIRCVLLEYFGQMSMRNARTTVADVDPIRVWRAVVLPYGSGASSKSSHEKIGVAPDFDCSAARDELAGVVEQVHQHLLELQGLEVYRLG